MSEYICVREVGLRDGLQLIGTKLSTKTKQDWLRRQVQAGFKEIEVTSMVPKTLLPQFSDATCMINFSNKFSRCLASVLVPNFKGLELAFRAKAKKIIFVVSASESHNLANVRMTVEQSISELKTIITVKNLDDKTKKIKIIG